MVAVVFQVTNVVQVIRVITVFFKDTTVLFMLLRFTSMVLRITFVIFMNLGLLHLLCTTHYDSVIAISGTTG